MQIRLANENDIEAMIQIEQIGFPPAEAAKEEDIRERFRVFPENFIVAEKDGKVIGFVNGCTTDQPELPDELYHDVSLHKPDGTYQTVFGLNVLPEYRREGIAALLVNELIRLSKERGRKGIVLTCKDHLVHYYERLGFEHQGVSASVHGGSKWNDMLLIFEK